MTITKTSKYLSVAKTEILSYLTETTVHGFRYIVHSHNVLERIFWTVVVTCGFLMSGNMILSSITMWKTTPLQTTIEKVSLPVTTLDFPAITVCHPESLQMPRRNRWAFVEKLLNAIEYFKTKHGNKSRLSGKLNINEYNDMYNCNWLWKFV